MSKQKNPENNHRLPLKYPDKKEDRKAPQAKFPKEDKSLRDDLRRIESINDAVYGKQRTQKSSGRGSSTDHLSGEFLINNYTQIMEWREDYLKNRKIPPQFDETDKKREYFLKLIGWE